METVPENNSPRCTRVKSGMTRLLRLAELLERQLLMGLVTFSVKVAKPDNIYVYILYAASPTFRGRLKHVRAVISNVAAGGRTDIPVKVLHMPIIQHKSVHFNQCYNRKNRTTLEGMTSKCIELLETICGTGIDIGVHANMSVVADNRGELSCPQWLCVSHRPSELQFCSYPPDVAAALFALSSFQSVSIATQPVINDDVSVRDIDGLRSLQQLPRGYVPHLAMAMRM